MTREWTARCSGWSAALAIGCVASMGLFGCDGDREPGAAANPTPTAQVPADSSSAESVTTNSQDEIDSSDRDTGELVETPTTRPEQPRPSGPLIADAQRAIEGFAFVTHTAPEGIEVPDGMVYVPGGTTLIGCDDGEPWERPIFAAEVEPFFMDIHPVTVAEFRAFVEATGFKTQAEVFGDAAVFDASRLPDEPAWYLKPGATWAYPFGPDQPKAHDDHPVTQVSWNDAVAYCVWAGKRLPTEVEWEHAARNAQNGGPKYAWGDELIVNGAFMANGWQGTFPTWNSLDDGFSTTAPVDAYPASPLGLLSMGGNVWEWCEDWYRRYDLRNTPYEPDAQSEKVQRGGSFLCDPRVCHGYRVSARAKSTPETSLCHVGFRCVKDIP